MYLSVNPKYFILNALVYYFAIIISSWDDETRTTLSFDEKYTHDSKGLIWYQIKGYYVSFRFPVVVGSKKCSVILENGEITLCCTVLHMC